MACMSRHASRSTHITARTSEHAYKSTHTRARMPQHAYHSTYIRARMSRRAYRSTHATARVSRHVYHSTRVTACRIRRQVRSRRGASLRLAACPDCSLFRLCTRARQRDNTIGGSTVNGDRPWQFLLGYAPTRGIWVCTFPLFRCWLPWPRPSECDCAGWHTRRKKTYGNATRQQPPQASSGPLRRVVLHCITWHCIT